MQLVNTSDTISFDPDPLQGALNQGKLTWTKRRLSKYGKWARFWIAQVKEDGKITISQKTDKKGDEVTGGSDLTINTFNDFRKTGNFSYSTQCSTNRSCNIFQKNDFDAGIWALIQFSFDSQRKVRENTIQRPNSNKYIPKFTRYKRHLYFIVKDDDFNTEVLYYVDLRDYNPTEFIPLPTSATVKQNVTPDITDIHAGEDRLYLANGTDVVIYNHGVLDVVFDTWSSVYTADSYDNYPVAISESDDLDIFIRKKGTQLYRIFNGEVTLLSDTLDEDLSNLRINTFGNIYVEGSDYNQVTGDLDEHKDKWYITNDALTLDTYLSGVVKEILTDSGISEDDIDLSEILDIQCRGFTIEGHTQNEALQQLFILYDFSLPIINGKVTAKKITDSTSATSIDNTKIGMSLNNPPQTVLTITDEISDTQYPKQVTVNFSDADDNYVASAVILRSQDSLSSDEQTLDFGNHSLSDSVARGIAHEIFKRWFEEKGFFNFTGSLYYLEEIQPGSLLSVVYGSETYNLKVTSVTLKDVLIDVTAVRNYV